jgi:hypothetical protein
MIGMIQIIWMIILLTRLKNQVTFYIKKTNKMSLDKLDLKSAYLLVGLIILVGYAYGQNKPIPGSSYLNDRIQQQANLMGQAFIKGDFQTFAKYTYPALVRAMGGESRMAATLTQTVSDMQTKGMTFNSISVDNPTEIVKSQGELQCTLQQHTIIKLANGKAVATSTLIAISRDDGKNWLFVDTNNKDAVTMRKVMPNLSTAIVIPPQQKPVFYSF